MLMVLFLGMLFSCGSNPYSKTNRVYKKKAKAYAKQIRNTDLNIVDAKKPLKYGENWVGTTNFNLRRPNFVVIHHTAQNSVEQTLRTFTLPRTQVSAHYVISDDGTVYHMLNDAYRAWHGGIGKWGNITDMNSCSIGIELDNNGFEPFSEEQISSLLDLLAILKGKYNVPTANFIGHSDLAPTRKNDPNITFPWEKLAEEGYGYWYDDIAVEPKIVGDSLSGQKYQEIRKIEVTENEVVKNGSASDSLTLTINPELALRIIGYDTSNMDAAIKAFKRHFIQTDINTILTESDLKILYNLSQKYL